MPRLTAEPAGRPKRVVEARVAPGMVVPPRPVRPTAAVAGQVTQPVEAGAMAPRRPGAPAEAVRGLQEERGLQVCPPAGWA